MTITKILENALDEDNIEDVKCEISRAIEEIAEADDNLQNISKKLL